MPAQPRYDVSRHSLRQRELAKHAELVAQGESISIGSLQRLRHDSALGRYRRSCESRNGNLLITTSEGVLNGPGLSLRNDRFYNGLSTRDGSFGGGWLSSLLADDIGLLNSGTTATFAGPSEFLATFTKNGSAYVAPFGFNATLIKDANGFTLTYNRTGEQLKFSLSGFLLTDFDRNGQGVTYTYSGSRMLSAFQNSGRHIDISYDTAGKVDVISDSAGRSVSFARNSTGQLKSVDSIRESFLYDSTGRLSEARFIRTGGAGDTASTHRVVFTYDSSRRVTAVKRGTVASGTFLATTTYTYVSGQTTITSPNGSASVFTIDTQGGDGIERRVEPIAVAIVDSK